MVHAHLMHTMRGEQFLDRSCSLDLGSERCWALVITTVIELVVAEIMAMVAAMVGSTFSSRLRT